MYKLYYSPGACSMSVHVMLNECEQPVELHKLNLQKGENRTPEFLKINSRGQVPTLVDGDQVFREGAAILMYLAEKHKSPLLPAEGKARTAALQALMFANATLHPAYGRAFFVMKSEIEEADKAKLLASSISKINDLWQDVERQLEHQPYLAGSTPTLGDIIVTVIANWSLPQPITIGPRAKKLFQTMTARPAYRKALDAEQVEYKAAA